MPDFGSYLFFILRCLFPVVRDAATRLLTMKAGKGTEEKKHFTMKVGKGVEEKKNLKIKVGKSTCILIATSMPSPFEAFSLLHGEVRTK